MDKTVHGHAYKRGIVLIISTLRTFTTKEFAYPIAQIQESTILMEICSLIMSVRSVFLNVLHDIMEM